MSIGLGVSDPSTLTPMAASVGSPIGLVVSWLYYALFECSGYQATPGKLAIALRVTDAHGDPVSFGRATARHFSKIISTLIFFIGYLMAGWTAKKQALHDIIASCLVIRK